jgi:hypothetical protein
MAIDCAGRKDLRVPGDYLCRWPYGQPRSYPVHRVRVAGFANGHDTALTHADVRFYDAPVVKDYRAGNDEVRRPLCPGCPPLAHRLAYYFPAAEDGFIARFAGPAGQILGDLDEKIRVG